MFFLYSFFATIVAVAVSPILLVKRRARFGVGQKLGMVPAAIKRKYQTTGGTRLRPIWFHCVSVGEFNAAYPLISAFHKQHPERDIVISTSTGTGQKLAQERAGTWSDVIYFPYDLPFSTASWLDALRPALVIIVETELWPGFLKLCRDREINTAVVNGRLSPRSFRSYYRFRGFFKNVLGCFTSIGVQSEQEAERYRAVGGDHLPVRVLGNLKFDGLKAAEQSVVAALRDKTGISAGSPVIVAGSTHEGEESALLEAHKRLRETLPHRLVLVPRHPERFDRVADLISSSGFRARRFSLGEKWEAPGDVYLLDAIGHLMSFYALADIAFVGGTIANIGGHNVAEPCVYATPVVTGPHLHKTKDVADALRSRSALVVAGSAAELPACIESLLRQPELRSKIGTAGKIWLGESLGAVERALAMIEEIPDFEPVQTAQRSLQVAGDEKQ